MTYHKFEKLKKIREANKSIYNNKRIQKKINRNKSSADKLRINQIKFNSPNEKRFRHLLIEYGIKHVWQKAFSNIERYVCVDFFFPEKNIIVEIDGIEHNEKIDYDLKRTLYLKKSHGVKEVIRITNIQIINNTDQVKDLIINKLIKK